MPIAEIKLERTGASAVILATNEGVEPHYLGLETAMNHPQSDVRIFGKPVTRIHRRMGVAVAYDALGVDANAVKERAIAMAKEVTVE